MQQETYVPTQWAARRLGKHLCTIYRWRQRGAMPEWLQTLAALELDGALGALSDHWRGWTLRAGRLRAPSGVEFTPGQIELVGVYRQHIRELERQLRTARRPWLAVRLERARLWVRDAIRAQANRRRRRRWRAPRQ